EETSDGEKWQLESKAKSIQVYSAKIPGKSFKRWKVVSEINSPVETVYKKLFDLEERKKWDAALLQGSQLYEEELSETKRNFKIVKIVTQPQGGGAISSREFWSFSLASEIQESGGYIVSQSNADPKMLQLLKLSGRSNPGLVA